MKATRELLAPAKPGDAGHDLICVEGGTIHAGSYRNFETAAVEIPEGCCGLVIGKSGRNRDRIITVLGLIDSGYRARIVVMLENDSSKSIFVPKGTKVAQLLLLPFLSPAIEYVDSPEDLSPSERGASGFGSTGT